MIQLDKEDQHSLHDFLDFAFSKEVIRDHPKILRIYDKILPLLYQHAQYQCVWPVIEMIKDAQVLAEAQLAGYSKIFKNKGKINDKRQAKRTT